MLHHIDGVSKDNTKSYRLYHSSDSVAYTFDVVHTTTNELSMKFNGNNLTKIQLVSSSNPTIGYQMRCADGLIFTVDKIGNKNDLNLGEIRASAPCIDVYNGVISITSLNDDYWGIIYKIGAYNPTEVNTTKFPIKGTIWRAASIYGGSTNRYYLDDKVWISYVDRYYTDWYGKNKFDYRSVTLGEELFAIFKYYVPMVTSNELMGGRY